MSGGSLTATPVRTRTVTRTVRTPQSVNQSRDLRNLEKTVATLRVRPLRMIVRCLKPGSVSERKSQKGGTSL